MKSYNLLDLIDKSDYYTFLQFYKREIRQHDFLTEEQKEELIHQMRREIEREAIKCM